MIDKHEIYAGKGGWQMKGLRQCFGNSKQAAARCASGWIEGLPGPERGKEKKSS